jgi:hypothetical protein
MRADGRRNMKRPRGAVLRPLGILIAAAASGFGMWHALMQDGAGPNATQLSRRTDRGTTDRVERAPRN